MLGPPALHLTFDDGPDPVGTPRVLDALASAQPGCQATFFVLGSAIRSWPGLVADILAAGHRVELHGDAHLDHRFTSVPELVFDTGQAIKTLADVGVMPQWWRLPWGRPGRATEPLAIGLGLRIVGWDADTHDWRGDAWGAQPGDVGEVVARGGVVLLHDGFGPGATRTSIDNTIDLIHHLGAAATEAGAVLRALPDPADRDAFRIPSGAPALTREPQGAAR